MSSGDRGRGALWGFGSSQGSGADTWRHEGAPLGGGPGRREGGRANASAESHAQESPAQSRVTKSTKKKKASFALFHLHSDSSSDDSLSVHVPVCF